MDIGFAGLDRMGGNMARRLSRAGVGVAGHDGYGMMQAFAEGFALMENRRELALDVRAIAQMWRHGSVVRSWLLDLVAGFLAQDPRLVGIAPVVADSGEGRWTVNEAVEQGLPAPALSLALMAGFASQGRADYASRLLAMTRHAFAGHPMVAVSAPALPR